MIRKKNNNNNKHEQYFPSQFDFFSSLVYTVEIFFVKQYMTKYYYNTILYYNPTTFTKNMVNSNIKTGKDGD